MRNQLSALPPLDLLSSVGPATDLVSLQPQVVELLSNVILVSLAFTFLAIHPIHLFLNISFVAVAVEAISFAHLRGWRRKMISTTTLRLNYLNSQMIQLKFYQSFLKNILL